MSATLASLLLPITKSGFTFFFQREKNLQRGFLSWKSDGESTFLENGSRPFPFTKITASHFEWQT